MSKSERVKTKSSLPKQSIKPTKKRESKRKKGLLLKYFKNSPFERQQNMSMGRVSSVQNHQFGIGNRLFDLSLKQKKNKSQSNHRVDHCAICICINNLCVLMMMLIK